MLDMPSGTAIAIPKAASQTRQTATPATLKATRPKVVRRRPLGPVGAAATA
jgi:hypothetical protein